MNVKKTKNYIFGFMCALLFNSCQSDGGLLYNGSTDDGTIDAIDDLQEQQSASDATIGSITDGINKAADAGRDIDETIRGGAQADREFENILDEIKQQPLDRNQEVE